MMFPAFQEISKTDELSDLAMRIVHKPAPKLGQYVVACPSCGGSGGLASMSIGPDKCEFKWDWKCGVCDSRAIVFTRLRRSEGKARRP